MPACSATLGVPTKVLVLGMSVQTPAPPSVHSSSQTWPKVSLETRIDQLPDEAPLTVTRLAGNGAQDQPVDWPPPEATGASLVKTLPPEPSARKVAVSGDWSS